MASATCGRNMAPYRLLDSPYSLLSVKIVLAAGNVTRTMPCTSAAALMTVRSVFEAIRPSRQLSPQVSPLGLIDRYRSLPAGPARCHPPSQDEAALPGWLPRDIDLSPADERHHIGRAERAERGGIGESATWFPRRSPEIEQGLQPVISRAPWSSWCRRSPWLPASQPPTMPVTPSM